MAQTRVRRLPSETVTTDYITNCEVSVTSRQITLGEHTYAVSEVEQAHLDSIKPNAQTSRPLRVYEIAHVLITILVSILIAWSMISPQALAANLAGVTPWLLFPLIVMGLGKYILPELMSTQGGKTYTVNLSTKAGRVQAYTTKEADYALEIVESINEAVKEHLRVDSH